MQEIKILLINIKAMGFKKYLLLAVLLASSLASQACDICGCFMGITPYDNQSGFSLMHRYRIFNGYPLLG
jgi:hypothetical protein